MATLTPMLEQYLKIKDDFEDSILIYRMGDFYEMFFEDAVIASKILNITVTSHDKKTDPLRVPMCAFPVIAVNSYLTKLVKAGQKVAVCEQLENKDTELFERKVVRVFTPGITLTVTGQINPTIANVSDPNFTDLPFVANIGKGKKKHRSYWQVRPNGNYYDELLMGKAYAIEALQFMSTTDLHPLLCLVVQDMPKGKKRSGIEEGFLEEIANFAVSGAEAF